MAKKWSDIEASDTYKSLPDEGKAEIRDRYWRQVIEPSETFKGLDESGRQELRSRFFGDSSGAAPVPDGTLRVPEPIRKTAELTGIPMRGMRGLTVGTQALLEGQGVQPALEAASRATQPGFEPREGEKIGAFVGELMDPRLLALGGAMQAAGVGVKAGMAGRAAIRAAGTEGAAIGATFGGLSATEKGYMSPNDALNIAVSTGLGGLTGAIGQGIINSIVARSASRAAKRAGTAIPDAKPSPAATTPPQRPDYMPSEAARRARKIIGETPDITAEGKRYEQALETMDKLNRQFDDLTPEVRTNLSQLRDEFRSRLERMKAEQRRLEGLAAEEQRTLQRKAEEELGFIGGGPVPRQRVLEPIGTREIALRQPDLPEFIAETPRGGTVSPIIKDMQRQATQKSLNRKGNLRFVKPKDKIADPQTPWQVRYKEAPKIASNNRQRVAVDTAASAIVKREGVDPATVVSSPLLPGTDDVLTPVPEAIAGSKFEIGALWSRFANGLADKISTMGQSGAELSKRIRIFNDVPQIRSAQFDDGFHQFLKGVKKSDYEKWGRALADRLEGRQPTFPVSDEAVNYVKAALAEVADESEKVGLTVLRANGEEVPFARRTDFFPRVVKKDLIDRLIGGDKTVEQRIADHLVKTRQADNFDIAAAKVQQWRRRMMDRRYGHLERARELDLPPEMYERNAVQVIPEYFAHGYRRLEEVRQFGKDDAIQKQLMSLMQKEGVSRGNVVTAQKGYERLVGIELEDDLLYKGLDAIRAMTSGMIIQYPSTILQLGQLITPALKTTGRNWITAWPETFYRMAKHLGKAMTDMGKREAAQAGQLFENSVSEYLADLMAHKAGKIGKFAQTSSRLSLFGQLDAFNRIYSANLGREWITKDLIPLILKNPRNRYARRELISLGLNPERIVERKGLTAMETNIAAKRFADMTQGAPNVVELPLYWSGKVGKFWSQFKSFTYLIGRTNYRMFKDAVATGNVPKAVGLFTFYPAVGHVIGSVREELFGIKNFEITGNEGLDAYLNNLADATAIPFVLDAGFRGFNKASDLIRMAAPVSLSTALSLTEGAMDIIKGDAEKGAKKLVRRIPVVGRGVATLAGLEER